MRYIPLVLLLIFSCGLFLSPAGLVRAEESGNSEDCQTYGTKQDGTGGKPIVVCTGNIFDEEELESSSPVYRWVNFLHIKTKPKYVEEKLSFEPGDEPDDEALEESERVLRAQHYISEADITETEDEIKVVTKDRWTTKPTFDYGSKGGVTTSAQG